LSAFPGLKSLQKADSRPTKAYIGGEAESDEKAARRNFPQYVIIYHHRRSGQAPRPAEIQRACVFQRKAKPRSLPIHDVKQRTQRAKSRAMAQSWPWRTV
jgi:hypothetical protein